MDKKQTQEIQPAVAGCLPSFGAHMQLTTLADAMTFADVILASGMAPKGMSREGAVIAMQLGFEVGLSPMQALQNIAPINGKPTLYGDAMLGLVRASGMLEEFSETLVGDVNTDSRGCCCHIKRVGYEAADETFTVADAKRAGLWGKPGPWKQYPQRMLKFRARGFALRDQFADVLKGLTSREEAIDTPQEKDITREGSDRPTQSVKDRTAKPSNPSKPVEEVKPTEPVQQEGPTQEDFIDAHIAAAVEAVGAPQDIIEGWSASLPPAHPFWTAGSLKQMKPDALRQMTEGPIPIKQAVSKWADEQGEK